MRTIAFITFLIVLYFTYGFYIGQKDFIVGPRDLKRENPMGLYDYRGIANVQTSMSAGSSEPLEVISDARKAGLDFIILTDVNQSVKASGLDGYHGNILAMNESEISLLDMRILQFSGEKDQMPAELSDARLYLTDLLSRPNTSERDNIVLLARPYQAGPTWTGELPVGFEGMEVFNPKSISQRAWEQSKLSVIWSLMCYPFNLNLSFLRLFQEPADEEALWDKISQKRRFFGYAGADASARAIPFASFLMKFPSYEKSFEIASNHILTETELNGDYQSDRMTILKSLKEGRFYFSLDMLGDPRGFNSFVQDKETRHLMGSQIKFNRNLRLVAKLPITPEDFYEIIVFKNGDRDLTANQPEINYEISGPGTYRVVVRVASFLGFPDGKRWITWIYGNPFFVK